MVVKKKAAKIIDDTPSLSKIIKSNILIKPIKTLNKSYTIDFGYANEEKIELIHSTPEKLKAAYEWLERINFVTENYTEPNKITIKMVRLFKCWIILNKRMSESHHMIFFQS